MPSLIGAYRFGVIRSVQHNLELLKNYRFTYRLHGCRGVYARASGTWQQKDGILLLTPQSPYDPVKSRLNLRFIPVYWGQRLYLIDENEMPGFCAAVQQKAESIRDRYLSMRDFVRTDEYLLPRIHGMPRIPVAYHHFLEQGEIKATVTTVTSDQEFLLQENGPGRLKPGTRLCLNHDGSASNLKVVSVDTVGVRAQPLPSPYGQANAIRVGDIFTTGSYSHRPEGTRFLSLKAAKLL